MSQGEVVRGKEEDPIQKSDSNCSVSTKELWWETVGIYMALPSKSAKEQYSQRYNPERSLLKLVFARRILYRKRCKVH
jgi:hypothetical protein